MRSEEKDIEFIRREVSKCVFCGFCEFECPTIDINGLRGYGPRGRIRVSLLYLEGIYSKATYEYIYTCLLCAACVPACPARIDIPGVVVAMRRLLNSRK
ncbi:MAG: (Fe-S)-binding protein [Sulfolobales archaeon]